MGLKDRFRDASVTYVKLLVPLPGSTGESAVSYYGQLTRMNREPAHLARSVLGTSLYVSAVLT